MLTPPNSPQYPEQDRYQYGGGRRQDVLQGQFVDVRQQQQQLEEEVELLEDSPVPVVIRGGHTLLTKHHHYYFDLTRSPNSTQ